MTRGSELDEYDSPWPDDTADAAARNPALRGGLEYNELHRAQRLLQDRLAGAGLTGDLARRVTAQLDELSELLADHQLTEHERFDGMRIDLPGRGHALFPPYVVDEVTDARLSGRVTFTRFFLGGNNTAHGGSHALLFDDVLGRVINAGLPGVARTASLKINYRRLTPLDVELHFDATRDSVDGRKRWGTARLSDADGRVLSDAEALFLQLLPGQG